MSVKLSELPVDGRVMLGEDLCDSIAADPKAFPITPEQRAELDRRSKAYEVEKKRGRTAADVLVDVRRRL